MPIRHDLPSTYYRVSLKALVFDDQQRLLVLGDKDGQWELPGGKLELSEAPELCLVREIAEELRLNIEPANILSSWLYTIVPGVHVLIITYGCLESSHDEAFLSNEHKELRWFPLTEIDALRMPEGYKTSIRSWSAHTQTGSGA